MFRRLQHLLFLVIVPIPVLLAADDEGILLPVPEVLNAAARQMAMPELGESRIAQIMERYYNDSLGGSDQWEQIKSLNVDGEIETDSGILRLSAYQKKPNLSKLILENEVARNAITLSYDGEVAWKQLGRRGKPQIMDPVEARRFIHTSHFGNYLLYPFAKGKTIRLIDTVPVEGAICHQIRVDLDTGYQVDYFIDIRSYLEVKVINSDKVTGLTSSIVYKDYTRKHGFPIAQRVENYENGELVSRLRVEEVKINSGVMPWMFEMPE